MTDAVVVTGIGVLSPLGHTVEELTRRVLAGARAASAADGGVYMDAIPLDAVPADKRARVGRLDRVCRLTLAAAFLAIDDAGLQIPATVAADRVGLSVGTALGCLLSDAEFYEKVVEQGPTAASPRLFAYTVSSAAAGEVSIALGIHGPNSTAHMGLAAGVGAIGYGLDLIRLGAADVVLAGGVDANGPALVQALQDMRLLKTPPLRDGTPGVWPSEGAAMVVLERERHARARRARVWGHLDGYAAGFEPSLTATEPMPVGLATTLRAALVDAACDVGDVDVVCASAHGTPLDRCERAALAEVLGDVADRRFVAPKDVLGECFGASGALALAVALGMFAQRNAETALISSVCYSGNVAALVARA